MSSLGHSVLVPALIGGSWENLVTQTSADNGEASPYLAFIVALHVATALVLLFVFRSTWIRITEGFIVSIRRRRIETSAERLAWLIVIATVPVGITGLLFEHTFRTVFAKPLAAAIFLTINGLVLLGGEVLRRRADTTSRTIRSADVASGDVQTAVVPAHLTMDAVRRRDAALIGVFQTFALFAGISRSGITMVGGLVAGLDHEDAARFSFLLATPVILAAGVLKLPTLAGSAGADIRGQVVVGSIAAAAAAYLSTKFLLRFFETRTLTPFAIYSLVVGSICIVRFA